MLRKKYKILTLDKKYKFIDVGWRITKFEKCKYCKNKCVIIYDRNHILYPKHCDDIIIEQCLEIKHNLVPVKYFKWNSDIKYKKL